MRNFSVHDHSIVKQQSDEKIENNRIGNIVSMYHKIPGNYIQRNVW